MRCHPRDNPVTFEAFFLVSGRVLRLISGSKSLTEGLSGKGDGTLTARILDGKALAKRIRGDLAAGMDDLIQRLGRPPGLGVILVGEDPASTVYVRNKERAATRIGMLSRVVRMPATSTQAEVEAEVDRLNDDPVIDGYLVQLPLPAGLDDERVLLRIDPGKDADGQHPENLGRLMASMPGPRPCTPAGVMALLAEGEVALEGKHAVVVGRSTLVGKPQSMMLLEKHATVTLCHSRTRDLAAEVRRAQVVVAAVGKPGLIAGDWIQPGAAVIDVGINRQGGRLVGDVDFEAAVAHAGCITPVPGGVGPMTIAMLLTNTVNIAQAKVSPAG